MVGHGTGRTVLGGDAEEVQVEDRSARVLVLGGTGVRGASGRGSPGWHWWQQGVEGGTCVDWVPGGRRRRRRMHA